MNGCDTFAYVDDALNKAHKNINPDDTTGIKYIDIVNNAMPAFFHSMSGATMALFRGLLALRRAEDVRADLPQHRLARRSCSSPASRTTCSRRAAAVSRRRGPASPTAARVKQAARPRSGRPRCSPPAPTSSTSPARRRRPLRPRRQRADDDHLRLPPVQDRLEREPARSRSRSRRSIHVMVRGYSTTASTFDLVGKKQ